MKAVAYIEPMKVEIQDIEYPGLELKDGPGVNPANIGRKCPHGVILKLVATNICGSDQHMVRGRTTAPPGLILGHEITGEVVEVGRDVEFIAQGDLVSTPFNIACGRCRMCKEGHTGVCLNVNPDRPGSAYGYVDMGGWQGGQAEYVMVPYADWNLLRFPDREQAMEKILDLTMLSDIFPTGYHGCVTAGVTTGSTVYVAGAGPVGLAAAASARLLGASAVIVGDMNKERLEHARNAIGAETIDLAEEGSLPDKIEQIVGEPVVDAAVDAVGFEARGHGADAAHEQPATVLNSIMEVTRAAGRLGIPGLYVTGDPGAADEAAKEGSLSIRIGLGWAKSHAFTTGQCPVMRYHRQLMNAILRDRIQIGKAVNATVISLDDAPQGYAQFDSGVAKKFVIDPHGSIAA
ncbi:formaldehyde dehydrogenase, glutathione-independent [Actinomycetospora sp. NBRC 106375]|uniref:formaldehyde dehydrogenase, glutathione-independent n=1 Tax=Actinomycetospora sp. NBRC 106375 TaxID=3032207 RepID=UPI0024A58D71|nr:formaldehyde dehydrogenase, glutathione-independent [Actinomycetospora sp. NBRC 106375]GLZ45123.1 formaldehyde dehydrogenase, glutathione-independent [Actinomycetospora sp. NBRC 106375]